MITAVITSALTSFVKKSAAEAQEREVETRALYQLTNHLTDATDLEDVAAIAAKIIGNTMNCKAACLCFDESGCPEKSFVQRVSQDKWIHRDTQVPEELMSTLGGLADRLFY